MRRIKLFEEFSGEWDRDDFLLDLFAMSSTEVQDLFFAELKSETPHIEKIEVMIESGLVSVEVKNNRGQTPLHVASDSGSIETAKLLIERGADVEAKSDAWGWTPLHYASGNDHVEVAKLLIDAGADLDAKSNKGRTPLHFANFRDSNDIINLLLEAGADEDIVDIDGVSWYEFYGDDWDANLDDDWYDEEGE